ncbi:hypothetical protein N431DRAFT_557850 [Stipitochalara longipes BDJ]|nr:hypothetical protein N431DRAFT_557850 [Stipitochalara longipes BDJ]
MVDVTDIAPELILEILSHLEFDRATLFLQLGGPHLDGPVTGETPPFDRVIGMLDRDPKLPGYVRTLIMSWSKPSAQIQPQLCNLLRQLPCLESLHISTPRVLDSSRANKLKLNAAGHPANSLNRLTRFRRSGGMISWAALNEFVNLPLLLDISLQYPPSGLPVPGPESIFSDRFASLRRLELGNWKGPGRDDPLATLLEKTKSLEVLHVSMCEDTQYRMTLSPAQVGQVLEPIRLSLKDLTIDGPRRSERSILDLTSFTSLQKIRAISDLFYYPKRADRLRDGMYWKLPKSLLELELVFMSRRGFIHSTPDPSISGMTVPNPDLELDWALQLAYNKVTHFPGLHSVSIAEDIWDSRMKAEEFTFPEKLKLAFEASSITLRGCCRVVQQQFIHRFEVMQ